MLRALLELSRVSNLPTVWTNVLAAWIIASGPHWNWTPALGWLLLGASLVYSAGMILNDACDAAWDREHRPERPIPSGRLSLRNAWLIGLSWLLGGYALMVFAGGANGLMTALLLAAILAYDVYHKPWAGSVIVMGACRTLLYLAAGSAVISGDSKSGALWGNLIISGSLLGLYVVALTLIARAEAKGGMHGLFRWSILLLLLSPSIWCLIMTQLAYKTALSEMPPFWLVVLGFVGWIGYALHRMSKGGPAIGQAVGLLLAGIPLVDAMFVTPFSWDTALAFCSLPPLLRLWQRWVAAT